MSIIAELKRRNVFRVGIAYVLMGWVILQGADFALDLIDAPNWVIQAFSILVISGLPIALFLAWAFEMTPEGIKREADVDRTQSITPKTGRKLDRAIIVFLVIAVGWLLVERRGDDAPANDTATAPQEVARGDSNNATGRTEQQSVAVLPFLALSNGPDDGYFADGLTEEILNSLAHVPGLSVTSRTSAFHFKGQNLPLVEIADRLGVEHVVEGSVRRSGDRLRVTAQLIRAADDAHLWSQNYDSDSKDTIAVQEDIAVQIVQALNVYLDEATQEQMQISGLRDVDAFIAYQKGADLHERGHGEDNMLDMLREGNVLIEQALETSPQVVAGWLLASDYYTHVLMDNSVGALEESLDEATWNEMFAGAENAFLQAARYATDPATRTVAQSDLAFLRGDWVRWHELFEEIVSSDNCIAPVWGHLLGSTDTYVQRYGVRLEQFIACDPYQTYYWNHLIANRIRSGDVQKAREFAEQVPTDLREWNAWPEWQIQTLLMLDREAEARSMIDIYLKSPSARLLNLAMVASNAGNAEEARQHADALEASGEFDDYFRTVLYARMGDRERANAAASQVDNMPMGYASLASIAYWCNCGAPFDLDAVPDFATRWSEADLPWPPASPIRFPLKDW